MRIVVTAKIGKEEVSRQVGRLTDLHSMLSSAGVQAMQVTRDDESGTWELTDTVTVTVEPYAGPAK